MAGRDARTGFDLVDKAALARASLRMESVLDELRSTMRDVGVTASMDGTLPNLSAFLLLDDAAEKLGYRPPGPPGSVAEREAARAAKWFSRDDADDNYAIDASEFGRLARDLGSDLGDVEISEALRRIRTRGSDGSDDKQKGGDVVRFPEFADWWVGEAARMSVAGSLMESVDDA